MKVTLFLSLVIFSNLSYANGSSIIELPTPEFKAAINVINGKCITCHAVWEYYSSADFVNAGYVVAKSPEQSSIYYRNSNAKVGPGPRNMPSSGFPQLNDSELNDMLVWINSL